MKMVQKIRNIILYIGVVAGFLAVFITIPVGAADPINIFDQCSGSNSNTEICASQDGDDGMPSLIKKIVDILLFILGAAAVLVIVVSGATFIMSNGDSSLITAAKNRILYAVIGIIVALMAYAIVNFVIGQLTKAT